MTKRAINHYGNSGSFHIGDLPMGCVSCIKGEKSVLYTTGRCKVGCYYCTIGHDRRSMDSKFINEVELSDDLIELDLITNEIDLCLSTGVGVTGGDPLATPERTVNYIRYLRDKYGPNFHIHLYTSGAYHTEELMEELVDAGLNEIRFHPKNIGEKTIWDLAINTKVKYPDLTVGFEIPAIPSMEIEITELIKFADNKLDFVNLNEFEFTDSNFEALDQSGFASVLANAAVMGSAEMTERIFNKIKDQTEIPLHFCSSSSKDSIQLVQRFKKRASQVARPFESISEEGELEYGRFVIFTKTDFETLIDLLKNHFQVDEELFEVKNDLSVETAWLIVDEITDELREVLPDLQAEIISRHPIENGPITYIDPR